MAEESRFKRLGNLLKNLKLRELSLVRAGANQHAEVVLAKDDDDEDDESDVDKDITASDVHTPGADNSKKCSCGKTVVGKKCACGKVMKYTAEEAGLDFADGIRVAVAEALEKASDDEDGIIDDMSQILLDVAKGMPEIVSAAVAKEREERESGAGTESGEPINKEQAVAEDTEVLKALPAEAQEIMKGLQETVKKQAVQLEQIRKAELRTAVTKAIGSIGVEVEPVVKLYDQIDEEGRKTLDDIFTKANVLAEESKLYEEVGTTNGTPAGAESELKKAVADIRKADPKITEAAAIKKALEENPELYDELDNTQAED